MLVRQWRPLKGGAGVATLTREMNTPIRTTGVVAKTVAIRSIMFTDTPNKAVPLPSSADEVSAVRSESTHFHGGRPRHAHPLLQPPRGGDQGEGSWSPVMSWRQPLRCCGRARAHQRGGHGAASGLRDVRGGGCRRFPAPAWLHGLLWTAMRRALWKVPEA